MGEFRMPSLGADMEVGTVLEWKVEPGSVVHRGDIVAVVDTEKSDIEVEVFENGVITELLVEPGVEVTVGTPLARIDPIDATAATGPGTAAGPAAVDRADTVAGSAPTLAAAGAVPGVTTGRHPPLARPTDRAPAPAGSTAPVPSRRPGERSLFVRSSPLARRLAVRAGLDLAVIAGSGPAGAVLAADVTAAVAAAVATSAPGAPATAAPRTGDGRGPAPTSERQVIGNLMSRSKREIPHYYLGTTIDLGATMAHMTALNAERSVHQRLLPVAFLLRATVKALATNPAMNGWFTDTFEPSPDVHLGVAVSRRGGALVAPAIRDANDLGVDELMTALRDLVQRTRAGRLRGSEMADPTITVTNLGEQGVDEVYGVLYPPQVALVGFGAVADRPWVGPDGTIGVRPLVRATLSADHRVSDGRDGARFLSTIDRLLQHPEEL